MTGKIIKIISNDYTVKLDNDEILCCKARGVFKNKGIVPLVGDNVFVDTKKMVITDIYKRKNELIRPPVSNVDIALIITSVKEPDFSSTLLDKLLTIIEYNNIIPVIVITKYDLLSDTKDIDDIIIYYKKIGYLVFINNQLDEIEEILKNKLVILVGQTGAGKSTFVNKLDPSLNLKTNEISKALGRGKHTTRHVELFYIHDALVTDTPGFSLISFIDMTKEDIRDNFIEFNEYKDMCKYSDCMHINENDCEIKRKVCENVILKSRYDNYVKFIKED